MSCCSYLETQAWAQPALEHMIDHKTGAGALCNAAQNKNLLYFRACDSPVYRKKNVSEGVCLLVYIISTDLLTH